MKIFKNIIIMLLCVSYKIAIGQHNNEFYNNGALISIQAGSELHVLGDIHMTLGTATLDNNGLIKIQGNSYSDALFQQTGTGTYLIENSAVNIGERQFIQGSFAVRGGTSQTGIDDGSFYDLELNNDQGIVYLVGTGNIADVRNSVNFNSGATYNRIVTHDIGTTGAISFPLNGSNYTGVFGLMNSAIGNANLVNNTISTNGNVSSVDVGYIQGKFRRAINLAGGSYGFPLGLEPAGSGLARGVQYNQINFLANNYDVVTGYFQQGLSNAFASSTECSGYTIDYFGGTDHGQWNYTDITGTGTGDYEFFVWPQDHSMPANTVWIVTKDNAISGTANDCGPTPIGLSRTEFNGFSSFGVASGGIILSSNDLNLSGEKYSDYNLLKWHILTENEISNYHLERSSNTLKFEEIYSISNELGKLNYSFNDYNYKSGKNYYRIKLKNQNDEVFYSNTIEINNLNNTLNIFPNPFSGNSINLKGVMDTDKMVNIVLFDVLGKKIAVWDFQFKKGDNQVQLEIGNIPSGSYYLKVNKEEEVQLLKLLKH